jgi:hypothetical protein
MQTGIAIIQLVPAAVLAQSFGSADNIRPQEAATTPSAYRVGFGRGNFWGDDNVRTLSDIA